MLDPGSIPFVGGKVKVNVGVFIPYVTMNGRVPEVWLLCGLQRAT